VFETLIGIGLFVNRFSNLTHIVLVLHLLGTFYVFIAAPSLMFDPKFPILTLAGEFVFKNAVLATSGIVLLFHKKYD
jgi:uncharacterized membrane protein YkgB